MCQLSSVASCCKKGSILFLISESLNLYLTQYVILFLFYFWIILNLQNTFSAWGHHVRTLYVHTLSMWNGAECHPASFQWFYHYPALFSSVWNHSIIIMTLKSPKHVPQIECCDIVINTPSSCLWGARFESQPGHYCCGWGFLWFSSFPTGMCCIRTLPGYPCFHPCPF